MKTKKMKKIVVAIASTVVVLAGSVPQLAFAGQYIWGAKSSSHKVAMESAFEMARQVVASRHTGCLGPGKKDNTTDSVVIREYGNKVQYGVFISHHDKSCGKDAGILGNANRVLNGKK